MVTVGRAIDNRDPCFQKRPVWYDFEKDETHPVCDKKRQVNIGVKVLVVIPRLFKPGPKFFEKLAVLAILELTIPPQKLGSTPVLFGSVSIQKPSD